MSIQQNTNHFEQFIKQLPANLSSKFFKASLINTPLGAMVAVADDSALYILEFLDKPNIKKELEKFCLKVNATITIDDNQIITSIKAELTDYFTPQQKLKKFHTPINIAHGSKFQQLVWAELCNTPYGSTRSYLQEAQALGQPTACRAVANANGKNNLAIIIPCHRIINHNGQLGGYACGLERKIWLLNHEKLAQN